MTLGTSYGVLRFLSLHVCGSHSGLFFSGSCFQSGRQVLQSSEVEDALGLKAIADLMVEVDSNLV